MRPLVIWIVVWLAFSSSASTAGQNIRPPMPAAGFFELPVTGGQDTYESLGLHPEERGVALTILLRQFHSKGTRALATDENATSPASRPLSIAAPFTPGHWRDLLGLSGRADIFPALVGSRAALLVAAGAMAVDPSIRSLLERDRGLLRFLMRTSPAGFWMAARSLRIEGDRLAVPGGAAAEPIWEALAAERVTRPAEFIRALVARDGGRLAWFFDTLAMMNAGRLSAALGPPPVDAQLEQARAFYAAFRISDQNWRLEEHPFLRSVADPWMVATQVEVRDGEVAAPSSQWLWEALFDRADITRRQAESIRHTPASPVTLAWLATKVATTPPSERRSRFEMVRFAQAVFADATEHDATDVLVALGGFRRYQAVLLSLDRMGISTPSTFARMVDAARRADSRPGRERPHALALMQGALAIVERARVARAIDQATAERLVVSLADRTDRDGPTPPAVAQWLTTTLADALPLLVQPDRWTGTSTTYESKILQAMAGPPEEDDAPTLEWEGLPYRVDLAAAERERLGQIREQLASPGLDAALASGRPEQIAVALLTLVYVPALGDPEGPALLGRDIAGRHDFGLNVASTTRRDPRAWLPPRDQVGEGEPWHVQGALLGLDLGLARLALRRIVDNEMPIAPTINLNDHITLARTVVAINARDLRDEDRDRLVEAIARGRQRIAEATTLPAILALAEEARLTAAERQTLPWLFERAPESIAALFPLRAQLWLGAPDLDRPVLDQWGVFAQVLTGRLVPAMPTPWAWEDFGGRSDGGLIGAQTPDLTLRMAQETARLKLPARLVPALLAFATQDYWHDVAARFPDDWPAMARQALALSPLRVEDYVAALAGSGLLRPRLDEQ